MKRIQLKPYQVQLFTFGIIGLLSTLIHLSVFSYLILAYGFSSLSSNVLAFLCAVTFSFFGHYLITFRSQLMTTGTEVNRLHHHFSRFLLSAMIGLMLNIIIAFIVIDTLGLRLIVSTILMGTVTPTFLFLIHKFWVFK